MNLRIEETSLARLFVKRVEQYGDRARFMEKKSGLWQPVTFRALGDEVREISLGLQAVGVRKGDRVCIMAGVRREWFACDWAIICAGALTVPIYPNDTPAQAAAIINHCQAPWAILDNMDMIQSIARVSDVPKGLEHVIVLENSKFEFPDSKFLHLDQLKAMGREYGANHPHAFIHSVNGIGPNDPLTIMYTSGTTGAPKGVVTTHGNYLFMIDAADRAFPLNSDDSNLQFLPPAHAFGRLEHFITHHKGITTWIAESMDAVAENLQEASPTFLLSVPRLFEKAYTRIVAQGRSGSFISRAAFNRALDVGKRVSSRLQRGQRVSPWLKLLHATARILVFRKVRRGMGGRLRFAISGAAPLSRQILEFFHCCGLLILEGWGMTETSTVGAVNRLDRFKFGTIGLPLPGVEMALAPDGEIMMRGPNVFLQYYRDPAATAEAVDEGGWLHTGDVGRVDEDGFFTITDRKKDLIITSGGKNVSPQKIENLLSNNPLIGHVMVYGDRRKYATALLTLNEANARRYFEIRNPKPEIPNVSLEYLASCPDIVSAIREWVEQVNASLASYETIKDFRIVPDSFSIDGGEMTPTLKIKRRNVIQRHRELLDAMYQENFDDAGSG